MERKEMKNITAGLKMVIYCVLVTLGAAVLFITLSVVALLLVAGPLLAIVGLFAGVSLVAVFVAIVFAGPPTAIGGGLLVSSIVRDSTN